MRFVLAILLLLAGCRSLPGPVPTPLDESEAMWVHRVETDLQRRSSETADHVERFATEHPDSVDARRYRQILRIARGEAWQVHEEARAAWEASPDDPDLLYLYARTIPDREIQQDLFRQAVSIEPSHFHANLGLAVTAYDLRDADAAAYWAQRAFLIRIDSVRANLLYARALAAGGMRKDAHEVLASLSRDDPTNATVAAAFVDLALQEGREVEALERIVACLQQGGYDARLAARARRLVVGGAVTGRDLRALDAVMLDEPRAWRLGAAVHIARGEGAAALALLDRGLARGADSLDLRGEVLRAALLAGDYRRALAAWDEGLASLATLDGEDRHSPASARLIGALASAHRESAAARLWEFARVLSWNGYATAATHAAQRAVALDPGTDRWQALAADLAGWERFLVAVRNAVRRSYWSEKTRRPRADLDEFLAGLAKASMRHLGRDVVSGIPVDDWPFVGSVARTDFEGAPSDWEEHGVFFVIGQRNGGPVQGTMMRIAGHWKDQSVDGEPYELLVGDGRLFRTYFEFEGGDIAGFAMPGRVVLDVDSLNRSESGIRRWAKTAAEPPLWPAPDEERRRSLWFPNGVRERLAARYVADGGTGAAFETALRHEEGHVLDGARYTPISHHVPEILYQAMLHGFSPSAIEVTLETHAETNSLMTSAFPRAALFGTTSFLPWRRGAPPHSIAYHDLLREFVAEIDEHPERYPSIDRGFNILQQLDRLTDEELRTVIHEALD